MALASATRLTLDYSAAETSGASQASPRDAEPLYASGEPSRESILGFNSAYGEVYADASRRAGRLNAASITDAERDALLLERQVLLDKYFSGAMTKKESNRLAYVRWSLDRIEDAREGGYLDALESAISSYEHFTEELTSLRAQIASVQAQKSK